MLVCDTSETGASMTTQFNIKWNYSLDASTEGSTEGSTEVGAMEASSSSSKGVEDRHAATKNTKPTLMTKSEMLKALLTNQQAIISKMNNAFYTHIDFKKLSILLL